MTHKCNKEVDLQKMKDDIGYIRKSLAGNGEQGLINDCRENTNFRLKSQAQLDMIKWLVGLSSGALIVGLINLIQTVLSL